MKKITYLAAITMIAFTSNAVAQDDATATSTATVVAPIAIANAGNINFGTVAVDGTNAGTVVLAPADTRTATGGVTLSTFDQGTVSAAIFNVTGEGSYTYSIKLQATAQTLQIQSGTGGETLTVDTFTSSPSGTGALASGAQTLKVGATLHVAGGQTPGTYISATPFTVEVNYN